MVEFRHLLSREFSNRFPAPDMTSQASQRRCDFRNALDGHCSGTTGHGSVWDLANPRCCNVDSTSQRRSCVGFGKPRRPQYRFAAVPLDTVLCGILQSRGSRNVYSTSGRWFCVGLCKPRGCHDFLYLNLVSIKILLRVGTLCSRMDTPFWTGRATGTDRSAMTSPISQDRYPGIDVITVEE